MWLTFFVLAAEGVDSVSSGTSILQIISAIGGFLGVVSLLSLPWTIKKLKAESRSLEVTAETGASAVALQHLKMALDEAEKALQRLKDDAQTKIQQLEEQVQRLSKTLEQERLKSVEERELYERKVVQLLYDLHTKDQEISNLKRVGGN